MSEIQELRIIIEEQGKAINALLDMVKLQWDHAKTQNKAINANTESIINILKCDNLHKKN